MDIAQIIAAELSVDTIQVQATIDLIDAGSTVPFIARYRKEATRGLDDTQLRNLESRLGTLRELEARRDVVLRSIEEQEKLTPALKADIMAADTRSRLEDLYLPYKPKRRTKAQIAREAGLAPLAESLLENPDLVPESAAAEYFNGEAGFADTKSVLDGARQILMEHFAEDATLIGQMREYLWEDAMMVSKVIEGQETEGARFADYFEYSERLNKIPSHRALALFRGRNLNILQVTLELPVDDAPGLNPLESQIARHFGIKHQGRAGDDWMQDTVRWAWKVKIFTHLDLELKQRLREAAEAEAIEVFARNLKDLLLAAPAGARSVIGLDPGLRSGVKVAVVDPTGSLVDTATIFPHAPRKQWNESISTLGALARKHKASLISIGNGTASRETDKLAGDLIRAYPELQMQKIVVSEAGASIYSASEFAAQEFPNVDVSLRGAASIARRLQDPLAELVKIEPKAIGVGQYQHDVSQVRLARSLENAVEDCVNAVGVELNTASAPLLVRVSGLNATQAKNIVDFRDENGPYKRREQLLKVPRLGAKAFEQAAGFLRINNGENPLDRSAVHPEAYPVVQQIMAKGGHDLSELLGNTAALAGLRAEDFVSDNFGLPTVRDILAELEKPGRDPRPEFRAAEFREGVEKMSDLEPGMVLEGVVSNVANFGAFVDIGVHQDGLVHISALADKFVKDPRDVVHAGDVVKVKVLEVDEKRKRIALTMRMSDDATKQSEARSPRPEKKPVQKVKKLESVPALGGALADALKRAGKG